MHIVIGSVWVVPAVPADRLLLAASVDMIPLMMQKGYKAKGWLVSRVVHTLSVWTGGLT